MADLTLRCNCGAFEAAFDAPPHILFNCQCHSCVSAVKGIEARDGFAGTSMKCDASENAGTAVAVFKSNDTAVKTLDGDKIGFMKVGDEGKYARPYCTDCGTMLANVWQPNWCAMNRNALTNADGSPYVPTGPVLNVNCKFAFDPKQCPEPKHSTVTWGILFKFIGLVAGIRCDGSNAEAKALTPEDMSKVEAVPVTWVDEKPYGWVISKKK